MIYYIQTSLLGLLILGIVYYEIIKSNIDQKLNQFLYRALILSIAALLFNEMIMNLLQGQIFDGSRILLTIVVITFYILNPLPPVLWILFVEKWIDRNQELRKLTLVSVFLPYTLHVIVSLLSLNNGMMFTVNQNSVYQRGPYYIYMVSLMIGYLIIASLRIIAMRKMLSRNELISLLIFPLPSIIGGLIQALFFGVVTLWISVTVAILLVFIQLQNVDMYMDHLTDLWNRRKLNLFFENLSFEYLTNQMMGGILIDVDDYKRINDRYGHVIGDEVLVQISNILKQTFNKDDFIARYGGDEFIVFLKVKNNDDLSSCVERLHKSLDKYNSNSKLPFEINLSLGYDIVDSPLQTDSEVFINSLDKKMYENKKSRKNSIEINNPLF
jgi:diguanylate cyclase (GGDEF)-like protein